MAHDEKKMVALVGNPNVGKSVVFNALSGAKATVSNYPGTTVGISRALVKIGEGIVDLIDTPGMYSLLPITEEELVARTVLFEDVPDLIVNIIDAKNLERMLSLTIQLIEAGFSVILALNMMDEAEALGIRIDLAALESSLGVPVVSLVAISGVGIQNLKEIIGVRVNNAGPAARVS